MQGQTSNADLRQRKNKRWQLKMPENSSHSSCLSTDHQDSYREWRYHMLLVYNYVLLKMSTWYSKHVEKSNILRINNSHQDSYREWRYHMLLMYNYVLLKMSTWYSKHVEESNNIWRINDIQCITLVILYGYYKRRKSKIKNKHFLFTVLLKSFWL